MDYSKMKKVQLIEEIEALQTKIAELERAQAKHKRAEEALQESEMKFRTIYETANAIIMAHDRDFKVVYMNPYACKVLGYEEGEMVGKDIRPMLEKSEYERAEPVRQQVTIDPNMQVEGFEQYYLKKGGGRVLINWNVTALKDAEGNAVGILGVGQDITERKRAEQALGESEERFRHLSDAAFEGITIHEGGVLLSATKRFFEMFGFKPDELLGKQAIPLTIAPEAREFMRKQIATGGLGPYESIGLRKDGTRFPMEIRAREMEYEGRKVRAVALMDITERKRAEEDLRKYREHLEELVEERTAELAVAKERAEAADRLKSAFLATMSHELRTPLNSIIGFTGIMLQGLVGPLNPEQEKQLNMVYNSAKHLLALINDILDLSKIEAGEVEIVKEEFDVASLINKVVKTVSPLAEQKGLGLAVALSPEVGRIYSDRRRVEQILLNLLNNAIKFTKRGWVRIEGAIVDKHLQVSVQDTGIGIKPEDMGKLFQVFRQIDATITRQHEGTGLGLAICKKLVTILGGEIWAESEGPGKGSVFTFTLPL